MEIYIEMGHYRTRVDCKLGEWARAEWEWDGGECSRQQGVEYFDASSPEDHLREGREVLVGQWLQVDGQHWRWVGVREEGRV